MDKKGPFQREIFEGSFLVHEMETVRKDRKL